MSKKRSAPRLYEIDVMSKLSPETRAFFSKGKQSATPSEKASSESKTD